MIKAVIFDCFGVLVGSGFWTQYEKLGGDLSKDGELIDSMLDKLNAGKLASDTFAVLMSERLGISPQAFQSALNADEQPNQLLFDLIATKLEPKYKLAIVSNATGQSLHKHLPADKLALFDEVLTSGEVGLLKPDPAFFKLALERLGIQAEEAVFIDDHLPYVQGAAALGIRAVQYKSVSTLSVQLDDLLSA